MSDVPDSCFGRRKWGEDPLDKWVKAENGYPKLILLKEVKSSPRPGHRLYKSARLSTLLREIVVPAEKTGEVVALDFETRGLEPLDPSCEIVGVGLSWETGTAYVDFKSTSDWVIDRFLDAVVDRLPLIAHNVMFDGRWIYTRMGRHAAFQACTLSLYRYLATEGFPNQRWGLKDAMRQCLGWQDTNEKDLHRWLVNNGWITGITWAAKDGMTEEELAKVRERVSAGLAAGKEYRPNKGEMWRAPAEILGHYCCLDADATFQLYTKVLRPTMVKFKKFQDFFEDYVMRHIEILIEQINYGIQTDVEYLEKIKIEIMAEVEERAAVVLSHPLVLPHLEEWNRGKMQTILDKEPDKYLKIKDPGPEPAKYRKAKTQPKKFTKAGEISKVWLIWEEKERERLANPSKNWGGWVERRKKFDNPPISKNWLKWKEKMDEAKGKQHFNLGSPKQLQWLLYEKIYQTVEIEPYQDKKKKGSFLLLHEGKELVELDYTESGSLPTDKDAFFAMGDLGKALGNWKKSAKELEFVEQFLSLQIDGVLHPQWSAPGTLTGRLSGNSPNFQQIFKKARLLDTFTARPGHVWVQKDFDSLENKLMAEVTRDSNLLELYASDKPHDGYMFIGQGIGDLRGKFEEAGYDFKNPTKEGVSAAKKTCKKERGLCKVVVLARQYGGGNATIFKNIKRGGHDMSRAEVDRICEGYDRTFPGILRLGQKLKEERRDNRGWIMNSQRPICVGPTKEKDVINMRIQSEGHDRLIIDVVEIDYLIRKENIPGGWIYSDFHDEWCFETPIKYARRVAQIYSQVSDLTNRRRSKAGEIVPLTGEPEIHMNMSGIKVEGYEYCDEHKEIIKRAAGDDLSA